MKRIIIGRMKNNLLTLFLLASNLFFSQTSDQFKKIAAGINTSYTDFEISIGKSSRDRETNFGLEKRVYEYDTFSIIAYEKDDIAGIDEISILSKRQFDNKESWYIISKTLNDDSNYFIVDSFVSSIKDKIYKNNLKFNEIVNILRNSSDLSDYIYYVIFKKNNIYYQMNVIETATLLRITKDYTTPSKK
ncbi:hypothetical protein [Chryseobacterium sediminis]|uniref:Uncharacterized protein n=1 Tax=Chryseobacterium sediminis TaxID=1679494 RepID=A0A5B2U986_9FLAO|nr:hypothetical protein [Chryseobacterium sediminis]KAA2222983.1 hypothetical protein FW780_01925 [Chryseobacterium sediminis]